MWDRKIIKAWAKQDLAGIRYGTALLVTWLTGVIGGTDSLPFSVCVSNPICQPVLCVSGISKYVGRIYPQRGAQPVYRGGKLLGPLLVFRYTGNC